MDSRLARGRRWFEYHCYEGEDSCDAQLWHHTHQRVKVLRKLTNNDPEVGRMYRVRFSDGLEYDIYDDELVKSPAEFQRPDYRCPNPQGGETCEELGDIHASKGYTKSDMAHASDINSISLPSDYPGRPSGSQGVGLVTHRGYSYTTKSGKTIHVKSHTERKPPPSLGKMSR